MKKLSIPPIIIIYEIILGSFELVFGMGILFFGKQLLIFYENVRDTEFAESSNYIMVSFIEKVIPNLLHHRYYIIILLLGLGIIKITSGVGLMYKKEWAKHLLIIFLTSLVPWDVFAIIKHISLFTTLNLSINILIILTLIRFKPKTYVAVLMKYAQEMVSKNT